MKNIYRKIVLQFLALTALSCAFLPIASFALDEDDAVSERLDADQDLNSADSVRGFAAVCQQYNYDYRRCVAAGCQFDGTSGVCFGQMNPVPGPNPVPPPSRPNYCDRFNYNQYQCQRAGCYFDHASGVCFDGSHYPPNPPGYRMTCVAVDAGYEEHARGHIGIGHGRYQAEQAALGDCLRYHGRCRIRECRYQ